MSLINNSSKWPCNPSVSLKSTGAALVMAVTVSVYESTTSAAGSPPVRTLQHSTVESSPLPTGEWLFCIVEVSESLTESLVDIERSSSSAMKWSAGSEHKRQRVHRQEKTSVSLAINGREECSAVIEGGRSLLHQNVVLGTIPSKLDQRKGAGLMIADVFWIPKSSKAGDANSSAASSASYFGRANSAGGAWCSCWCW